MSNQKNSGRVGEANFLINFSRQGNNNNGFHPSSHHNHYKGLQITLMVIIVIIVIYLIGFGVYVIHHHFTSAPVHHARVTRVTHIHKKHATHGDRKARQPKKTRKSSAVKSKLNRQAKLRKDQPERSTVTSRRTTQNQNVRTAKTPVRTTTTTNRQLSR